MLKLAKRGKKAKDSEKTYSKDDLWIAPRLSPKRNVIQSDWKLSRTGPSESNRFLELADVAFGFRTAERRKRKATA
jgi:hypothetical protein